MKKIFLTVVFASTLFFTAACSKSEEKKEVTTDDSKIEQLESRVKELESESLEKSDLLPFGEISKNKEYDLTVFPLTFENGNIVLSIEVTNKTNKDLTFDFQPFIIIDKGGNIAQISTDHTPVEILKANEKKKLVKNYIVKEEGPYAVNYGENTWQ